MHRIVRGAFVQLGDRLQWYLQEWPRRAEVEMVLSQQSLRSKATDSIGFWQALTTWVESGLARCIGMAEDKVVDKFEWAIVADRQTRKA